MKLIKNLIHYVLPLVAIQTIVDFSLVYPLYQLYGDNGDLYGYVWAWIPWFIRHFISLIQITLFYYGITLWSSLKKDQLTPWLKSYKERIIDWVPVVFLLLALLYRMNGPAPLVDAAPFYFWLFHLIPWITMVFLGLLVHKFWTQKNVPIKWHVLFDGFQIYMLISSVFLALLL